MHPSIPANRRKGVIAYTACIALSGLGLTLGTLRGFPAAHWPDFLLFLLLACMAEYWIVPVGIAPVGGAMSTSFTVNLAAVVLFGPAFGALAGAFGVIVSHGLVRRRGLLKTAFNAGQVAVTAVLSGLAFDALRAGPHLTLSSDALAFAVATALYVCVITALPTVFLAFCGRLTHHQLALFLRQDGLFYIAMGPLGALVACAYQQSRWNTLYFPFLLVVVYKGFELFASLMNDTNKAVVVLADTVDKRDPYTHQHSLRVAEHVAAIAERLPLSPTERALILSAARVHDLGKISTDNRILFKEGPLTEEEFAQIRAHPADGAELAGQFSMYRKGRDYIRHHHERWDGGGYPDGLAGEAIPLGARIIAVADSFDAMTSDRPYRAGLPRETAIEELRRCSGTQFDPRVVEAFLAPEVTPVPRPAPAGELADSC